jgi:hypothetical protein
MLKGGDSMEAAWRSTSQYVTGVIKKLDFIDKAMLFWIA